MQVAPSAYWRHAARQRNPEPRSARAKHDEVRMPQIERVWQAKRRVYGATKVRKQLKREGIVAARCTVEWPMRRLGSQGVRRGTTVRTTVPDRSTPPAEAGQPAVQGQPSQPAVGVVPPAEADANDYRQLASQVAMAA